MGRIEISLNEYNSLKDKIKSLEEDLVKSNDKIEILKNENNILEEKILNLKTSSLFERFFKWKTFFN